MIVKSMLAENEDNNWDICWIKIKNHLCIHCIKLLIIAVLVKLRGKMSLNQITLIKCIGILCLRVGSRREGKKTSHNLKQIILVLMFID